MTQTRWIHRGESHERLLLTIHALGLQPTAIRAHGRRGDENAYLAVTIGHVVTYCADRAAVDAFTCAWRTAARYAPRGH